MAAKRIKCRWCAYTIPNWPDLKDHILEKHEAEFIQVENWLHETTMDKLIFAKRLARQGMKGHKA